VKRTRVAAAIFHICPSRSHSLKSTCNPNQPTVLPLLGERAGVRANVYSIFAVYLSAVIHLRLALNAEPVPPKFEKLYLEQIVAPASTGDSRTGVS